MSLFGVSEGVFRLSLFVGIFFIMSVLEAWQPRRARRHTRSRRWTTNIGILISDYAAVFAFSFFVPVSAVITAMIAEQQGWGLLNIWTLPGWLSWIVALLVLDFVIWAQHYFTHKIPVLWRLHRVHHADEDMDTTTAVRFHPLEIIFSILVKSLAVVALGPAALMVVIFEAIVNGSALFNHANVRLPMGLDRIVRLFLVTPDMHRVHHSVIPGETDSNYGFALSIWDRIFGTYIAQPSAGHDDMRIGLSQWQDGEATKLGWSLALPFWSPPKSAPANDKETVADSSQSK